MAAALLNKTGVMVLALKSDRGFSLPELMLTVAVAATLTVMAVPLINDFSQSAKLNEATRLVERELQSARLKAVSTNSILRVHTNCPSAGEIRTVELLGTAKNPAPEDSATNRCSRSAYPFPPTDNDLATRPNYDGPVRILPGGATVTTAVLEFRPDGTVGNVVSNFGQPISVPVTITVTRRSESKTVTVNGVGKVQ